VTAEERVLEIARKWREQVARPAPLPREPYGFDVMEIDTLTAECVEAFLDSPKRFGSDKERLEVLRTCVEDIDKLWDGLDTEQKEYLGHLRRIASEILAWPGA